MKKIFTTFIAVLFILFNVFSDPINEKEAKQIAENFYNAFAPSSKTGSSVNKSITETYQKTESFYIFGFDKGGFVIISADDNAVPILGYSFTSPIEEKLGPNIRYLFDCYNKEIADIKTLKIQDADIKADWEKLRSAKLTGEIKAAGPLLTTTWGQGTYYNDYCPSSSVTGCVATAMSQIMNYNEWPASGNGWHKYIPKDHPEYGILYVDFASEVYDWANMTDALSGSSSSTEIEAVATLNYHAGVAVNMNYSPSSSGASTKDVLFALTLYFKYDPTTVELVTYDAGQATEYLNKIKTEIDNNRPIYYDGHGADGGHAWVCDGYDDSDNVHINWGWDGSYDGYFLLSDMTPGSYDFTDGNSMIIGIKPGTVDQDMLWTKQASGFEAASRGVQYIYAIDKRIAWATAYDGSGDGAKVKDFTRTIDGFTWESGTINADDLDNYSTSMITAIDENIAWVALYGPSGGGKIVKTEDGGKTWTHQSTATFSASDGFPNVVHFWDANNGWCQGDPNDGYFEFYTTTDGGTTWTRVPEGNIPASESGEYGTVGYYAVYGNIVWFATNKGRIYKSTDKGLNWNAYQTPISGASFELSFRNENIGVIQTRSDSDSTAYITNNGGENWTQITTTGNFYTNSFTYIPGTNTLISTGSDYETPFMGVSYSTDDGATFTDYAEFYQNHQFLAIGAAGADAIWAGGFNEDENNDGMWHYGDILISAGFTADDTAYCASEDVIFTDNSYGSPESWSWDFGDGASPASATGVGPHTITYSTGGMKNITLTIDKGTDQHILVKNEFIYIAGAVPNDAGTITGDAVVTAGETHTYFVTNQENVTFNWDIPSPWTGTSTINEIEIEFTGASCTATITVTPSNVCGDGTPGTLEITADPSTGIDDLNNNEIFSVYPNPAKESINIVGVNNSDIYIYNSSGKLVKKIDKSDINSPINISDLGAGIYHISVIVNDNIYTKTISIMK
ncbi:MAG: C10 family peptidase [Bacteroidales bacterium]|nr:C10 family peptidase [Bacteroidales bacterium]